MPAKRVLFVERNRDGTVGGSHRVLLEVLRHLDRTRFDPTVVFYEEHLLISEFRKEAPVVVLSSVGVRFLDRFPVLGNLARRNSLVARSVLVLQKAYNFAFHSLPWFLKLLRTISRERVDLVCINNSPFVTDWLLACKLSGRPCVSFFRSTPTSIPKWKVRLFPRYDAIMSISQAATENARKQGAEVDNFVLVYDGIDSAAVQKAATKTRTVAREEFVSDPERKLVGVVNHIRAWKGQHVAVEAIAILKDRGIEVTCLLVGDVANADRQYLERLKRLAEDRGVQSLIGFTGRRDDVPDILSALDIVIHTSVTNEGLPRIILETMALGRPLVASSAGPNVEMIEEGVSGFLVPPNDPVALADRLERLLGEPDLLAAVGARARERAESIFDIETNVRHIEQVFASALQR